MKAIFARLNRCLREDAGATAVEYAILGSLIAAVVVGSVTVLGTVVAALFGELKW